MFACSRLALARAPEALKRLARRLSVHYGGERASPMGPHPMAPPAQRDPPTRLEPPPLALSMWC